MPLRVTGHGASRQALVARSLLAAGAWLSLGELAPPPLHGQSDSTFHTSLRGWAEDAWLVIMDRNGAAGGRISERGILQRFDVRVDNNYFVDQLVSQFSLTEEFEWHHSRNGVRWLVASITKADLLTQAEFKVAVPIDARWTIDVRFDQVSNAEANRAPVRFGVSRDVSRRLSLFGILHIDPEKSGSDVEAGLHWELPGVGRATFSLAALDFANDVVYLHFDAVSEAGRDSTLEYARQPFAARAAVEVPLGRRVRLEATGALMRPSVILQYEGRTETDGLRQNERFGYVGALVEWAAAPSVRIGGWANTLWAETEREPITPPAPVQSFALTERTTQVGVLSVLRLSRGWTAEGWLRHTWRPERREWADPNLADVDFLLRTFNAQAVLGYIARSGFTMNGGLGWNRGSTPRGDGEVPATGQLKHHRFRVRLDVGVTKAPRFRFLVGPALDINAEAGKRFAFGGVRGRVMLLW